jgi:hypothetical protein
MNGVLMDNLTAPIKRRDGLVLGRYGFGIKEKKFAAPNHSRGIERQEPYCSDVKL